MNDNSLHNLIREGTRKYGDIDKAVVYIRRMLDRHKSLRDEWLDILINAAIRERVHWLRHGVRTSLKRTERGPGVIASVSHIAAESILDEWPFLDKTLGDATRSELLAEVVIEDNSAIGHRRNATFYRALARKLTRDNMCVRDKIDSQAAAKLWEATAVKEPLVKIA